MTFRNEKHVQVIVFPNYIFWINYQKWKQMSLTLILYVLSNSLANCISFSKEVTCKSFLMKFQCADETRPDYIHWYVLWACKWLPNHAVTSLSPSLHRRRAGSIQQWDPLCSRLALRKDQWGPAHTGLFTINLDQVMCKQGHEREQKSLPGGLALTRASDRSCQVSKWGHMVSQM